MNWYRRLVWPFPRSGGWPGRTPPTVPGTGPVAFHCPACKHPVDTAASSCSACGAHLLAP